MSESLATPAALMSTALWQAVEGMSLEAALELAHARSPVAARILYADIVRVFFDGDEPVSEGEIALVLEEETLATWAALWAPPRRKDRDQGALGEALSVLATALRASVAPPPPAEPGDEQAWLGPLASMTARALAARLHYPFYGPYRYLPLALTQLGPQRSGTLAEFARSPLGRGPQVQRELRELAGQLQRALAEDAPARARRIEAWRALAERPGMGALVALREAIARTEIPVTQRLLETCRLEIDVQTLSVTASSSELLACTRGECQTVVLALGGESPRVACRLGGHCRLCLLAVERTLSELASGSAAGLALADALTKPPWRRMLDALRDVATPDARPAAARPRTLGWLLKAEHELVPAWLETTKTGTLKAVAVTSRDLDFDAPMDAAVWGLVEPYQRGGPNLRARSQVARALGLLVGSEVVAARVERATFPVRVELAHPQVEVDGDPATGLRVMVRQGGLVWPGDERPPVGDWVARLDAERARVVVGRWSNEAVAAWSVVRRMVEVAVPPEAASTLAETLLAVAPQLRVRTDATWLGDPHAPAPDVVFRLGFDLMPDGSGKALAVSGLVHPVPELGPLRPGEGDEVVPVRRDGVVGHVARAFAAERASVEQVAGEVGLVLGGPLPEWRVVGVEAAIPVWQALERRTREGSPPVRLEWRSAVPRLVRASRADKLRLKVGLRRDWLDVTGGLALDGGELPLVALLAALRDKKRFIEVDGGRVIEIDEALRAELQPLTALARTGKPAGGAAFSASPLAAPLLAELESAGVAIDGPPEWLAASQRMREAATLETPVPSSLQAELRPYQREGLTWLQRLAHWAPGGCLADDMGLGKTVMALGFLLARRGAGPALVVAPTSVVPNWRREAARFAPDLEVAVIARGGAIDDLDGPAEVVVTSWDLLVRHADRFAARRFGTVVLDEAHAMKNAATRRAQIGKNLDAGFLLALTGTPVENRPSELWSLFQAVAPGLLGSAEAFREGFARAIEQGDGEASRRLARLVRPFILRRRKAEVATDLPSRSDVRVDVVLSGDERERYESVRRSALASLAAANPEGLSGGKGLLQILVVLTRLRQLACHPRLVDPKAPATSAKLERLVELASELRDEGRRMLVFSQFTELLALVRTAFDEAALSSVYLDGETPADKREGLVEAFQSGRVDAFILSLKAGGVGLNLNAATEVIHLDPWWNPAVEDQATDRAHRIGQDRPVTVYRMVAQGTIEEQILALHGDKRRMVSSLLEGTASTAPMSAEELMALLSEEGLEVAAEGEAAAPRTRPTAMLALGHRQEREQEQEQEPEPEPQPQPEPEPAAATPLERVVALLRAAAGEPLRRADLVLGAGLTEGEWLGLRDALATDPRIEATGHARGRSYRLRGGA